MCRLAQGLLAVLLLVLAGCQRLNYEKEATLDLATTYLEYTFPRGETKVNVKATSDQPVSIWVVPEEDQESSGKEIKSGRKPAKALAGEENQKEIDFEAAIPDKTSFVVFVAQGKGMRNTATVKLSVKGK